MIPSVSELIGAADELLGYMCVIQRTEPWTYLGEVGWSEQQAVKD